MSAVQSTTLPWMRLYLLMNTQNSDETNFFSNISNSAQNIFLKTKTLKNNTDSQKFSQFKSYFLKSKDGFLLDFFLIFGAFVYGNLFAIQFSKLNWGFILIFGITLYIELLQKFLYLLQNRLLSSNKKATPKKKLPSFIFFLTIIKRGFLLGFFLEAFKVGS